MSDRRQGGYVTEWTVITADALERMGITLDSDRAKAFIAHLDAIAANVRASGDETSNHKDNFAWVVADMAVRKDHEDPPFLALAQLVHDLGLSDRGIREEWYGISPRAMLSDTLTNVMTDVVLIATGHDPWISG